MIDSTGYPLDASDAPRTGPGGGVSHVTVRSMDDAALTAQMTAALDTLLPAYESVAALLDAHFDWTLTGRHLAAFDCLDSAVWLACGLSLPCCAGDDEDRVAAWRRYVEAVHPGRDRAATTGR